MRCWICGGAHDPTPADEQEVRDAAERILASSYLTKAAPPPGFKKLNALLRDAHLVATASLTILLRNP